MEDLDRLLTIKEMAEKSNLSESYFYTNRSLGTIDLEFLKIGRSVRATGRNFSKWLASKTENRCNEINPL